MSPRGPRKRSRRRTKSRRRLRGQGYPRPLASELDVRVSPHTAQAWNNAPSALRALLYGTRFRHSPFVGMNLSMTVGVDQDAVLCLVASPILFVDDMVVVPTRFFRDWLLAFRTDAPLFLPQFQW